MVDGKSERRLWRAGGAALLTLGLFGVSPSVAATYYVAKTGSDLNTCAQAQSLGAAKLTINAALACMASGDTVSVEDGVYDETIQSNSCDLIKCGSSGNPTIFKSTRPHGAVIKPTTGDYYVIQLNYANSYIVIDGFVIDGSSQTSGYATGVSLSAFNFGDIHHVQITNNQIKNTRGDGIGTGKGSSLEIAHNDISNWGTNDSTGHAHAIYATMTDSTIENNVIHDGPFGYGIHLYNFYGCPGMTDNVVRSNLFYRVSLNNFQAAVLACGESNTRIYNNVFHHNAWGISITQGGSGAQIYNNTFFHQYGWGIYSYDGANTEIKNNILWDNESGSIYLGAGSETTDHNLCNSGCGGAGTINAQDPRFNNAAAGDFQLLSSSPAVNAGADLSAFFTADYAGRARRLPFDIGALEFAGFALAWQHSIGNCATNAVDGCYDGFYVFRRIANGSYALVGPASGLGFTDAAVQPGERFCYEVTAYNSAGQSALTNEACATRGGVNVYLKPGQRLLLSRRATDNSSTVAILVNANEQVAQDVHDPSDPRLSINLRAGLNLAISRRATSASSIVSMLVNKSEVVTVNNELYQ